MWEVIREFKSIGWIVLSQKRWFESLNLEKLNLNNGFRKLSKEKERIIEQTYNYWEWF